MIHVFYTMHIPHDVPLGIRCVTSETLLHQGIRTVDDPRGRSNGLVKFRVGKIHLRQQVIHGALGDASVNIFRHRQPLKSEFKVALDLCQYRPTRGGLIVEFCTYYFVTFPWDIPVSIYEAVVPIRAE